MTLQGWAERILLGSSLDDKLATLPQGADDVPRGFTPPKEPGRPAELAFRRHRADRSPTPGQLRTPEQRGRVLHLFANHELLALELMALALLRFSEVPRAFRRGLAGVMAEEQDHLRAYLDRMAACGTPPGSAPVGAFFWDVLHPIDDPARWIAGLALTLEQANLDFSREWAVAFRRAGDLETADVLDRVYADEIRHVRHGVHWFRQWTPDGDLFTAYEAALRAPLGPHRARGTGAFDAAGRAAAGLPPAFVERVRAWGASRGRSPDLYWFNPAVESEVLGATPSRRIRMLERDLAVLPFVLAGRDDRVLVPSVPSLAWQTAMLDAGFSLPAFSTEPSGPVRRHRPWGWSRRAAERLGTSAPAGHAERLARTWWVDRDVPGLDPRDRPVVARTVDEAAAAVDRVEGPWVIKAPYSAGGRDRIRGEGPLSQRAWVARFLAAQGAVVVERWVDGVLDLSILCEDGRPLGITRFGVYGGAWIGHHTGRWTDGLPPSLLRFAQEHRVGPSLEAAARAVDPGGAYGVDALVYREAGVLKLRPVVEVNARLSFGRIALALGRRQHPATSGWLSLVPATYAAQVAAVPLVLRDGRPYAGALALNEGTELLAVWWLDPEGTKARFPDLTNLLPVPVADPLADRAR